MSERRGTGRASAKEHFWRKIVQGFDPQRTTVRQWCADHGVSEPSFYGWRRELKRRDQPRTRVSRPNECVRLLPVKVAPPPATSSQGPQKLTVRLKRGVRLLLTIDQLPAVLDVLERRPC
jgi:transposase-like protein